MAMAMATVLIPPSRPTGLVAMFDHLSDPRPPTPGPEQRAAVGARARRIRRRERVARSVLTLSAVLLVLGASLAFTHRSGGTDAVDVLNTPGTCCGSVSGTVRGDQGELNGVTVMLLY